MRLQAPVVRGNSEVLPTVLQKHGQASRAVTPPHHAIQAAIAASREERREFSSRPHQFLIIAGRRKEIPSALCPDIADSKRYAILSLEWVPSRVIIAESNDTGL
jgi:hypothetical protein